MIFVTTGTMLPFDRMIRAMDVWAAAHPSEELFAQTGNGSYEPQHMRWARLLGVDEFAKVIEKCSLVVAHAGTGSFFLAAEKKKPIVMLPRQSIFHEHTTDHQVHTARWLREKPGVYIAMTEEDLGDAIAQAMQQPEAMVSCIEPYAPQQFLLQIRNAVLL